MKRPLSRLRLTPRGRLRRNVVLQLLLPLALLLVLRPCFTHQAALERLQSRFHFGPVDAAQWYPEEAIYALRYDRWYAVCSLERQPFFLGHTWRPDARGLIAAPVEDAPLSVCGIHYDLFFGLCSDPAIESVRITCTGDGGTHTAEVSPDSGGLFLWCAPERLPTYTLYTAQALDGQGQVLYTVERTMVDEHDII